MKYLDAVKELEEINLKDKFELKFQEVSVDYFNALKHIDYIHSLPSLLRSLISFLDY